MKGWADEIIKFIGKKNTCDNCLEQILKTHLIAMMNEWKLTSSYKRLRKKVLIFGIHRELNCWPYSPFESWSCSISYLLKLKEIIELTWILKIANSQVQLNINPLIYLPASLQFKYIWDFQITRYICPTGKMYLSKCSLI